MGQVAQVFPASFAQRRNWLVEQLVPGTSAYHIPFALRLRGPLDTAALDRAVRAVVARHEALRTVVAEVDGRVVQAVLPEADVPVVVRDLPPGDAPEAERIARELAAPQAPFDLSRGPLLRVVLLRLGQDDHVMSVTLHHAVSDMWSCGIFIDELTRFYQEFTGGPAAGLAEPELQYADFTIWQLEQATPERTEGLTRFWRSTLLDAPRVLELPADRKRPATQSLRGGTVPLRWSPRLSAAVDELAGRTGVTPFMLLLAAFQALLGRYADSDDVVVSTAVSTRTPETESVIGCFVNTVPLRTSLAGAPAFTELLARVRDVVLDAFDHQDLPFERLVEEVAPERDLGVNPLTQVMFVLQNAPLPVPEPTGITVERVPVPRSATQLDLNVQLWPTGSGYEGFIEYSTDLFDASWAHRMAAHWERLLDALVTRPGDPVDQAPMTGPDEHRRLAPAGHPVSPLTLPELFAAQAAATPGAPAVLADGAELTYGQLRDRVDRLARLLTARGAGAERVVAVLLPPGVDLVAALLAVSRAGSAYLPLSPGGPDARLAAMLTDAAPTLVITTRETAASDLMARHRCVFLDDEATVRELAAQREDAPAFRPPAPGHPAYVIYTSGSTGTPKGVVVEHGALGNYLQWARSAYPGAAGSVRLHSSAAFDFAVTPLHVPLVSGGRVHVAALEEAVPPREEPPATLLKVTPSHLPLLTDLPAGFSPSTDLVIGGEALGGDVLARWRASHPSVAVVNEYGPTEATVGCTAHRIAPGDPLDDGPVPIGEPVWNTCVHVLDRRLRPAPAGELYVAGAGLARGYLGRAAATAERFVADPFGPPGSRMYRTGDRVRLDADGRLHYLGRSDRQTKIRGFRLEPGEIEAALREHPAVSRAAVVVHRDGRAGRTLTGYVVAADGTAPTAGELRDHLAARLPDHLVPRFLMTVDALPLTANGKLDEAALPAPVPGLPRDSDAPGTPREDLLCSLIAEVLDRPRVGVDEGFFELGGDSILSIQLVSRARRAGLVFSVRDVFLCRTARRLAATADAAEVEPAALPADAVGAFTPPPIMRWLAERGGPVDEHHQTVALRTPPALDAAALTTALQTVLDHHDALRLRLTGSSAHVTPPGTLRAADCLRHVPWEGTEDPAHLLAREAAAARSRLDAAAGRTVQAVWCDAGPREAGRLLLVLHHLVVDGVSWRIILPDLVSAYEAAAAGGVPRLEPVGTSYRAWAGRMAALATAPETTAELEYWERTLSEPEPPLGAHPWVPGADRTRATSLVLPHEATEALLTTVPAAFHAGVEDILLAALAIAVGRWRRRGGSVLVDVEGHGREGTGPGTDLSRTVGWFTRIAPARLDPGELGPEDGDRADRLATAVKRVKEQLRQRPGAGLGYGLLRHANEETAPRLAGLAVPQICFNYLGIAGPGALHGWSADTELDPLAIAGRPATHPLTVDAVTRPGPDGRRLATTVSWAERFLTEESARELGRIWHEVLTAFAAHAGAPGFGGRTPGDLPLVDLTQDQVHRLEEAYPALADVWPLTPLQQGLAFHSLYSRQGPDVYTVQTVCDLDGRVDRAALRAAADLLVDRHPNLRVAVRHDVQVVLDGLRPPWQEADLRDLAAGEREAAADRLLREDRDRRFDLARPPLLRFLLIRLGERAHRLVLTHHHVLLDGWSMPILMRELLIALQGGALPPAPDYRDHLTWLARQDGHRAAEAWRAALDGFEEPTRLASAAPAPAASPTPEWITAELPALREEPRRLGLTAGTLLQGALGAVLRRLTGRDEVVFGTAVSGRSGDVPGADTMVGLLTNTVPVRVRWRPAEPVLTNLVRLQDEQAELVAHQHAALGAVQQAAGHDELFDTLLVVENYPFDRSTTAGLGGGFTVTGIEVHDATHYAVTLVAAPTAEGSWQVRLGHRPDVVDRARAELILACLTRFVELAVAAPHRPLGLLGLPDEAPRPTAGPPVRARSATLPELFAERVAATPDAVAVTCDGVHLSYAEVNARANRLAHRLIARGAGLERYVVVALPRSADLVVALLAVVKSGAAYVPVDAEAPAGRLKAVVEATAPVCVLSSAADADAEGPGHDPVVPLSPDHPAYVIHTSGSTGRPKGVVVAHRNVTALFDSTREEFKLGPGDTWTMFHSPAFDFSVWELWGALLHGGRVVVVPWAVSRSPAEFLELLAAERVTVLSQTPSAAYQLTAAAAGGPALPDLRLVVLGGEAVDPRRLDAWLSRGAGESPAVVNMYGITETTVHVTRTVLERAAHGSPIGDPLPHLGVRLLDSALRPVPPGVPGEIYVAGASLARGYLGKAPLSAERFVADPYGPPGTRMYRSGDMAVRRRDGGLEFAGRADDQVKVRGFRIEPGEIEAAALRHPLVSDAAVVLREDLPGGPGLVAYLVSPEPDVVVPLVRDLLRAELPDHLVPRAFAVVGAIPLTANGKADRRALPRPDAERSAVAYLPPVTELEVRLTGVLADVLRVPRVGLADNFFDLGGHSVLAMTVVSRMREEHGVDVPVRLLFESSSVVDLAGGIARHQGSATTAERIENLPRGTLDADGLLDELDDFSADELNELLGDDPMKEA